MPVVMPCEGVDCPHCKQNKQLKEWLFKLAEAVISTIDGSYALNQFRRNHKTELLPETCLQCDAPGALSGTGLCPNCSGLNDGYGKK